MCHKKYKLKRILIIFIIVFITIFIPKVYAEDTTDKCSEGSLLKRYKIEYKNNRITITPNENDKKYKNVVFTVAELLKHNIYEENGSTKENYTNIDISQYNFTNGTSFDLSGLNIGNNFRIKLSTTNEPDCKSDKPIEFTFEYGEEGIQNPKTETFDLSNGSDIKEVTMNNTSSDTDVFINIAKNNKSNSKIDYTKDTNTLQKFKCDVTKFYKESDLKDDNYYKSENRKYLYGYKNVELEATYNYNYTSGQKDSETTKCNIKCEEGVVVEYGPPVATKAGLCFEYKIKVTSKVKCNMTEKPKKPKTNASVCTPSPYCVHQSSGAVYKQAGPSEEFDTCVKKCDGGKYTKKCTNKCYKSVYGESSTSKTSNLASNNYNTLRLRGKLDTYKGNFGSYNKCVSYSKNKQYGGCYTYTNGGIEWLSKPIVRGRYYINPGYDPHSQFPSHNYFVDNRGFYRADYGWSVCDDVCSWVGCGSKSYLNYGEAENDYTSNIEKYNSLVSKCEAAASCSTKTAEFTISVDYTKNKETKITTINFPYSTTSNSKTDKLGTCKDENNTSSTACNSSGKTDNNKSTICKTRPNGSVILQYAGCYNNCENNNYYMTEWSFPGTWMNGKTGEISYVDKSNFKGWRTEKQKFCVPLDAKNVNTKWWSKYYAHILSDTKLQEYKDKYNIDFTSLRNIAGAESDVDSWNIKGKVTKFGYIGWDIDVSCFYSMNKPTTTCTGDNCNSARVRTVDLKKLFPVTESGSSNTSSTSRQPGFNWTSNALITNDRVHDTGSTIRNGTSSSSGYFSNPSSYAENVQKIGYKVYSDKYLDYEFTITPSELKTLKRNVSDNNYTNYNGNIKQGKDGVSRYKSNIIHGSTIKDKKVTENFDCNNMENYQNGC